MVTCFLSRIVFLPGRTISVSEDPLARRTCQLSLYAPRRQTPHSSQSHRSTQKAKQEIRKSFTVSQQVSGLCEFRFSLLLLLSLLSSIPSSNKRLLHKWLRSVLLTLLTINWCLTSKPISPILIVLSSLQVLLGLSSF